MFLFKGSINVVTDINLANAYSQSCKVVYIGELNSSLPPNFIEFSVLLPPYKALEAEINGDMNAYSQIYLNYLMNNEPCFEAIMTIITAAYITGTVGGAIFGTSLGAIFSVPSFGFTYVSGVYAFGGMICGLFSKFGKIGTCASFLISGLIISLQAGDTTKVIIGVSLKMISRAV